MKNILTKQYTLKTVLSSALVFFCTFFSVAQTSKTKSKLTISADFPGGNIVLDSIAGDQIYIHQDINGIWGNWFYWNFKVTGAEAGKKYTFNFTHPWADVKPINVIGVNGPAVSTDNGNTWQWLGKKDIDVNKFTYQFPAGVNTVNFSVGIPYTEANYRKFMERYKNHPNVYERSLTVSEAGRKVERLHIGKVWGTPKYKVLITARHHACEMMANFVLEGLISSVLEGMGEESSWLRENVEFLIIPFMDKDGVEEGRQGKNQRPRDHNSDYKGESLWSSVSALKSFVSKWSGSGLVMAIDIHCPGHRGPDHEKIYLVGSSIETTQEQQRLFSLALERSLNNSLPYKENNNIKFGTSWNKGGKDTRFTNWAHTMKSIKLITTMEVPYSNASGTVVTEDNTRAFGRDLSSAICKYLKEEIVK